LGLLPKVVVESSPLQSFWSSALLLHHEWGFPRAYLYSPVSGGNLGIGLAALGSAQKIVASKSLRVLAAGYGGHLPPKEWRFKTYADFDSFRNSVDGRPIRLYKGRFPNVQNWSLAACINLGSAKPISDNVYEDKEYKALHSNTSGKINYGFDPLNSGNSWDKEVVFLDPYYSSNRHGEFIYNISIPKPLESNGCVFIDLLDFWHNSTHERVFGIYFQVNNRDPIYYEIDLGSCLQGERGAIAIPLFSGDQNIRITWKHIKGDIPFANGLRVFTQKPL
jgi:hypothetical protein